MHKGVILLTKADSADHAKDKVAEFMEPYGNGDVWDWYSIGNRWHNTLAPTEKVKEFHKKAIALYPVLQGTYAIKDIENDEVRPVLQKLWEDCGLTGKNPYWSAYGFSVEDTDEDYNTVTLSSCINTVKEWCRDLEKVSEELWNKMIAEKNGNGHDMTAYYAKRYSEAKYEEFCFEINVFNIDTNEAETIPDDIDGYYAVMVDMHN